VSESKLNPWRVVAAAGIVVFGVAVMVAMYSARLTNKDAAERDFISYWAAGQQLVHGKNPYDFEAVRRLELGAGKQSDEALLMMRNPPLAFPIALPLGFVTPKTALILWLLASLGGTFLSTVLVWSMEGRPPSRLHLAGLVFPPVFACLAAAQFGVLLLLGVVLFLYWHKTRPWLAGAALLLCSLKPHLFLPFGVVLIAWCISRKAYRILGGFAAALLLDCALSVVLDAHAWSHYSHMMQAGGALWEKVPTLSVYLRFAINVYAVWLQFVPQALASVWALWYFLRNRDKWNWLDQGMIVLLVGAMCTPFGWFTDECMVLPAVLIGLYRAVEARRSFWPLVAIGAVGLIEFLYSVSLTSPYYLWSTPAWLAWYLYATGRIGSSTRMRQKQTTAVSA
jgi:Glycosyltransferase family 87